MPRLKSHEGYRPEDEVVPGVFITADADACDVHIVDQLGEIVTFTHDEIKDDPLAFQAALCAVILAANRGPTSVRTNLAYDGETLAMLMFNTRARYG